jgi:hypothetical protein
MDEKLREKLLAMRERDRTKRQELIERRELHLGYHPEMERVHVENAEALEPILDAVGWPTPERVGEDGAEAALVVALHAISRPAFQRRCLLLVDQALEVDAVKPLVRAMLADRIRYNQRRPQRYGTIFDWDEDGQLSPWTLDEPERADARRAHVGLPPLEESIREARERAAREGAEPPAPHAERQTEILAWARRVGWVED